MRRLCLWLAASAVLAAQSLEEVATAISQRDLAGAERGLTAILAKHPGDGQALGFLAVVRAEQGRDKEAERLFREAITAAPRLVPAHVNLGRFYAARARCDEAIAAFDQALRIDPHRRDATTALIAALRQCARRELAEGDKEKALAQLRRARTLDAADPEIRFEFAMAALHLSLFEDAARALETALRARPDEPRYLYALARSRLLLGELPQSEQLFRRYVVMKKEDATGHYALGYVLSLLRRAPEARDSLQRSLDLQPVQTEAPYRLGLLALAEEEQLAAQQWFARVLERAPRHAGALLGMGQVAFQRGEYVSAKGYLEQAIAVEPSLAKAHYHLSRTFLALKQPQSAQIAAQMASKLEQEQKQRRRVVLRLLEVE